MARSSDTATTVDSASYLGWYRSVPIGTDGLGLISYQDVGNSDLKVLHCGNAAYTFVGRQQKRKWQRLRRTRKGFPMRRGGAPRQCPSH